MPSIIFQEPDFFSPPIYIHQNFEFRGANRACDLYITFHIPNLLPRTYTRTFWFPAAITSKYTYTYIYRRVHVYVGCSIASFFSRGCSADDAILRKFRREPAVAQSGILEMEEISNGLFFPSFSPYLFSELPSGNRYFQIEFRPGAIWNFYLVSFFLSLKFRTIYPVCAGIGSKGERKREKCDWNDITRNCIPIYKRWIRNHKLLYTRPLYWCFPAYIYPVVTSFMRIHTNHANAVYTETCNFNAAQCKLCLRRAKKQPRKF